MSGDEATDHKDRPFGHHGINGLADPVRNHLGKFAGWLGFKGRRRGGTSQFVGTGAILTSKMTTLDRDPPPRSPSSKDRFTTSSGATTRPGATRPGARSRQNRASTPW